METAQLPSSERVGRGMLVLGLLSAILLGPITGVPGLIWARWLRPLSGSAWLGYALCWYGCFVSWTLATVFAGGLRPGIVEVAVVLALNFAWLMACRKWWRPPARSRLAALLIAMAGTLMMGTAVVPSTAPVLVPLPLGILVYAKIGPMGAYMESAVALMLALPFLCLLPAHLAIYWPTRELGAARGLRLDELDERTRGYFRYGVAYLVGGWFLAWTIGMADAPLNRVFGMAFDAGPLTALLAPVVSIASALVDLFSPALSPGEQLLQLSARVASFLVPFCITIVILSGRYDEWLRLFGETRASVDKARR